ncbi:MAG TPA: FAD:protein FMN transferase [Rickettsiales bacterium]|nr:FAD:protein FMN transferase [Rickettsiales bacterium]
MKEQPQDSTRRARPWLGTIVTIAATGPQSARAVEVAFREIEIVHRLMSFYEAGSDVTRINIAALMEPVRVAPATYEVLTFANTLSLRSQSSFDITMADQLMKAGYLPQQEQSKAFAEFPSFRDIVLLPDYQVMRQRHVWIDLGGIAKGYAVDRAIRSLRASGMHSGIVNAGGDLAMFGESQPVYIRHPENQGQFFLLEELENCAVASSGGTYSEKEYQGSRIDPLVSPSPRLCTHWQYGVTVIAPDCMTADALTKIVRLSPTLAPAILDDFDAAALIADTEGLRAFASPATDTLPTQHTPRNLPL